MASARLACERRRISGCRLSPPKTEIRLRSQATARCTGDENMNLKLALSIDFPRAQGFSSEGHRLFILINTGQITVINKLQ